MKVNSLIAGVVGIIICAVMIGGALLPAVDGALKEPVSITNTGVFCYYDEVDSFTLTNGKLNDESLNDVIGSQPLGFGLVVTDAFIGINYKSSGDYVLWSVLTNSGENVQANVEVIDNQYTLTSPADNNVIETGILSFAYIPAVSGEYGIIGETPFILNKTDEIVFLSNSSSDYGVSVGTVNNMDTVFKFVSGEEVTDFEPTINYVWVDDGRNVELSKTIGSQIIAPVSTVVYENADGVAYDIMGVLPIIAIAGLIMAGIYVFISRR